MPVAVKWVPDATGRFAERPHFDPAALDEECERIVRRFLASRHGRATYPVTTDDLTLLIEEHAESLDQFADLPAGIEGRTTFHLGSKPDVAVTARLQVPALENRLRTTLTHEFAHVVFHTFIWEFARANDDRAASCNGGRMLSAPQTDWMEWQAGYASGAFLVPLTAITRLLGPPKPDWVAPDSPLGSARIAQVQDQFHVSQQAAHVRLAQLRYVLPA